MTSFHLFTILLALLISMSTRMHKTLDMTSLVAQLVRFSDVTQKEMTPTQPI